MKKAKEFAKEIIEIYIQFGENKAIESGSIVIDVLINESKEIEKQRKAKSYSAILSVLKEQNIKWQSIVNNVNKEIPNLLNHKAFLNRIETKMTMIYPNLITIV